MNVGFGTFFNKALIFGVVAAVINTILFFVGNNANGDLMQVVRPGQTAPEPLSLMFVIALSIIPCIVAALLYFLLQGTGRASLIFTIIAIVIFVFMFFSSQGAAQSTLTNWVLQIMHLVVGIAAVEAIAQSIRTYRVQA